MKLRIASVPAVLLILAVAPSTGATVTFDFTSSLLIARPGQTVSFSGTLTNIGTTVAFITGDSFTFPLPVNDLPFLLNVPPLLAPSASFTGPLLEVTISPDTPLGLYVGVFDVLGGDTPQQFNVLASRDFGVQVVPEATTWSCILSGVLAVALMRFFRRSTIGRNLKI